MGKRVMAFAVLFSVFAFARPASAQRIRGQAFLPDSVTRAAGIIVMATDEKAALLARALTSERGEFDLALPGAGRVLIRALRIGFRPTILPEISVASGETRTIRIVLGAAAVTIATVNVRGQSVCRIGQDSGQLVARLWEEARKALTASQLITTRGRLVAHWTIYDSVTDRTGRVKLSGASRSNSGYSDRPFISTSPDSLARFGYVVEERDGTFTYWAPDADVLLSASFAELHCFHAEPPPAEHADWVGVAFRPARQRGGLADIDGTLWLDRESAELRRLDFRYTGIPREYEEANVGGRVEFQRLSTGNWIVNRWVIWMPRASRQMSSPTRGGFRQQQLVVTAKVATGGLVTSVARGPELIYTTGEPEAPRSAVDSLAAGRRQPAHDAMCGGTPSGDEKALLHGNVLEGAEKPVTGAKVEVSWREGFRVIGVGQWRDAQWRTMKSETTTAELGWWFFCGVPRETNVTLRATLNTRETEMTVKILKQWSVAKVEIRLP